MKYNSISRLMQAPDYMKNLTYDLKEKALQIRK